MSKSIRKHFSKLLKEHDAKKPSSESGYSRNIGKRSRKEINVGSIHELSGLFETFGSESDPTNHSPPILSSLAITNRRSICGETSSTPLHGGNHAREEHPSPPKKSRLNSDARVHNLTVSVGTQTLQDIDLIEEEHGSNELYFEDDDIPNATHRNVGTQMESDSLQENSTFRRRTSQFFRSHRSSATRRSSPVKVLYKDNGTSMRQAESIRRSSQSAVSRAKGDFNQSGSGYSGMNKNCTNELLTMISDHEYMDGEANDERHSGLSHGMASTSRNTDFRSRSARKPHVGNTPRKVSGDSERHERKTPISGRCVLDAYTEMIDSQRKLSNSLATKNNPTTDSSQMKQSSSSLRKRLSFRNDANARSPYATRKPVKAIEDHIASGRGDIRQIGLDDVIDECHPASPIWMENLISRSTEKLRRRHSGKLRSVRTEPKLSQNYGTQSSNLITRESNHTNRNQAKRELSFSGRCPKRNELTTKQLNLSSKAKKSLDYPSPRKKSANRLKKRLSTSRSFQATLQDAATYSLVDYSVSDEDNAAEEADIHSSKSHKGQDRSNQSQKKQRRSSRYHRSLFKSVQEENMAAEVKSSMLKSSRNGDPYSVTTSDDDGGRDFIRLSTDQRTNATRSRIPIPSSNRDFDSGNTQPRSALSFKQRKSTLKKVPVTGQIESNSSSNDEEYPTVIENPSQTLISPRKANRKDPQRNSLRGDRAPCGTSDHGDGPVTGTKSLEDWLRTADQENEQTTIHCASTSQIKQRRSKYLSHEAGNSSQHHSFGNSSVLHDRESISFNRFQGDMNKFGPPSSTPRVSKASRTKPSTCSEVSDEGEGDDLGTEGTEESAMSCDSYTLGQQRPLNYERRRSKTSGMELKDVTSSRAKAKTPTNQPTASQKKGAASSAQAKSPTYQPTPKYRKIASARKRLSSFGQTNLDDVVQSEANDSLRVSRSPTHDELSDRAHIASTQTSGVTDKVGVQDKVTSPATKNNSLTVKNNAKKRGNKGKKKNAAKSKSVSRKKSTQRSATSNLSNDNSIAASANQSYVVLPLPPSNENEGVRRSSRIRSKVFGIGEGFEYSDTFDEHGFPKIIGIRVKNNPNNENLKKGKRKQNTKPKSKSVSKKTRKTSKKSNDHGTVKASTGGTNISEPNISNSTTLPTISEEAEPPNFSGEVSANQTIPISERTVNVLNSTTNSYNTIDLLSIVSNDDGFLGAVPPSQEVFSGVKITRGINLSESGISSTVQGRIVIKPRKRKAERTAGSGTMCFFVHQGSLEVSVSGEAVFLPRSSYFQVPHKNRYSLFNPDNKIDTILFYSLNVQRSILDRT